LKVESRVGFYLHVAAVELPIVVLIQEGCFDEPEDKLLDEDRGMNGMTPMLSSLKAFLKRARQARTTQAKRP